MVDSYQLAPLLARGGRGEKKEVRTSISTLKRKKAGKERGKKITITLAALYAPIVFIGGQKREGGGKRKKEVIVSCLIAPYAVARMKEEKGFRQGRERCSAREAGGEWERKTITGLFALTILGLVGFLTFPPRRRREEGRPYRLF